MASVPRPEPDTGLPAPPGDWPAQAADTIVEVVDGVRAKTTNYAVVAARALVFGLVIGTLAVVAGVLLLVGVLRAVQVGLGSAVDLAGGDLSHAQAVWISYLAMGAVLLVAGSMLWKKANNRAKQPQEAT